MWGNLGNVVGAAIKKVKTIQNEIEASMDAAVGVENSSMDGSIVETISHQTIVGMESTDGEASSSTGAILLTPDAEVVNQDNQATLPEISFEAGSLCNRIELDRLSAQFNTLLTEHLELKAKYEKDLIRFKKAIEKERSNAQQQVAEAVTTIVENEKQKSESEQQSIRDSFEAEKSKLTKRIEDIKAKAKEQKAELISKCEQKIKLLEDSFEIKIQALSEELATEISSHKEAQNHSHSLKVLLQQQQLEVGQLQLSVQSLQQQLSAATSAAASSSTISESNGEQEALISKLQDRIAVLSSESISFQQTALESSQKVRILSDDLNNSSEELKTCRAQLAQKTTENKLLEGTIAQLTSEVASLQTKVTEETEQFESNTEELTARVSTLEQQLVEMTQQCANMQEAASANASKVASTLDASLQQSQEELFQCKQQVTELQNDVAHLKEVIQERERSLETVNLKLSESIRTIEEVNRRNADLNSEIAEKDKALKLLQSSTQNDVDFKKLVAKLQDSIKEKDDKLSSFEIEGQALSRKQGELEKAIRAAKKEIKEKETEVSKLKESKDQLVKAIEEMQEVMRKNESEATSASKSLSAMAAVTQATSDKLSRLESELANKTEELLSQRRALELSWQENSDYKRLIAELRAERDDLKRQIGEGTSKVLETEHTRKEIEQREQTLRQTSKQLQESLQRQMAEANAREDRLQQEANEMRKRWQEAITSRETMAAELAAATTPLLKQISALQETLRTKSESWQVIETSLTERALRAESNAEIAAHKQQVSEEQLLTSKNSLQRAVQSLSETSDKLRECELDLERCKRNEVSTNEKVHELESRLQLEIASSKNNTNALREMEARHKQELADMREQCDLAERAANMKISRIESELQKADEEKRKMSNNNPLIEGKRGKGTVSSFQFGLDMSTNGSTTSSSYDADFVSKLGVKSLPDVLPSGEVSFAALEKGHQQQQRKLDDIKSLQQQIHQLQLSRDALLEEVNYLSATNSQLEDKLKLFPETMEQLTNARKQVDVLLVMLGEKEEELEAAMGDMKEVRNLYREQLDQLLVVVAKSVQPATQLDNQEDSCAVLN